MKLFSKTPKICNLQPCTSKYIFRMKTLEYEDNKKILDFQPCTSKYIFRMKTLEYEDNKKILDFSSSKESNGT